MSQAVALALSSIVSLMGLWCLVAWLYRDYCMDLFRQGMFKLRDQLFDEAHAGRISFSHPAYGLMRTLTNGFIRFGHRLTFLHLLAANMFVDSGPGPTFESRWKAVAADLDPQTREMLNGYLQTLNLLVIEHVVRGSLFLTAVTLPIGVVLMTRQRVRRFLSILSALRRPIDEVDTIAVKLGEAA